MPQVCFGTEAFSGAVRRPCTVTALTEIELMYFETQDLQTDAASATALADRVFASSVREALRSTVLFKHLQADAQAALAPSFTLEKVDGEIILYREGDKADCLMVRAGPSRGRAEWVHAWVRAWEGWRAPPSPATLPCHPPRLHPSSPSPPRARTARAHRYSQVLINGTVSVSMRYIRLYTVTYRYSQVLINGTVSVSMRNVPVARLPDPDEVHPV